jgi:hypothetical protein
MDNDKCFYDEYYEFKGYKITVFREDGNPPANFSLTKEDFENKRDLITWMDFLIKTNQWIPYAVYEDLFGITEYEYIGLRKINCMKIQYIEVISKAKDIHLY